MAGLYPKHAWIFFTSYASSIIEMYSTACFLQYSPAMRKGVLLGYARTTMIQISLRRMAQADQDFGRQGCFAS